MVHRGQARRFSRRFLGCWSVLAAVAIVVGGCSGQSGVRLPVSGTVKFRGKPLHSGTIDFQSIKAVGGGTVRDGKYAIAGDHGLPPGVYRVTISSIKPPPVDSRPPGPDAKDAGEELIPPEFNVKCEKTVEVKVGEANQFDFNVP